MLPSRDEESKERLAGEQAAWLQSVSTVAAAAKAEGNHPNPRKDDPFLAKAMKELLLLEKALPREALGADWDSGAWKDRVRSSGDASALKQALAELEEALQEGWVSPAFQRNLLLVRGAWLHTGGHCLPG